MNIDLLRLILAFVLGTSCGLKTELEKSQGEGDALMGGIRTYAILSLLGILSGLLYLQGIHFLVIILAVIILLLVLIYYASGVFTQKAYGLTSEFTILIAFAMSFLFIATNISSKLLIAISILVIFITTAEDKIHTLREKIAPKEIVQFSVFAVIALVILPFLPNEAYSFMDLGLQRFMQIFIKDSSLLQIPLLNPYQIWFIVVIFSSIEAVGYVLNKFIKHDSSIILTALLGGFLSSTTTTVTLAHKTEGDEKHFKKILSAIFFTNATSYIKILLFVLPISPDFFESILFISLFLFLSFFILGVIYYRKFKRVCHKSKLAKIQEEDYHIISLLPALKFAVVLTSVKIISSLSLAFLGNTGFMLSSLLASITGVSAVVFNIGDLVSSQMIPLDLAMITFLGVQLVNILSKSFYIFRSGSRKVMLRFLQMSAGILFISLVLVLLNIF